MAERTENLQRLLDLVQRAMVSQPTPDTDVQALVGRIFTALGTVSTSAQIEAATLPVCQHLPAALAAAGKQNGQVAAVAAAFADLAPQLCWRHRPGPNDDTADFRDRHGSARIIGPGGLEARGDITVGASLVAPGTRYPDHRHPPEEIYLVLSPGQWRQEAGPWWAPGPGGLVHNPPNIVHAMRAADDAPLLAIWCLEH